jgi:hypothetical protein
VAVDTPTLLASSSGESKFSLKNLMRMSSLLLYTEAFFRQAHMEEK